MEVFQKLNIIKMSSSVIKLHIRETAESIHSEL